MKNGKEQKSDGCSCCGGEFMKTGRLLADAIKSAKAKYDQSDEKTKKTVIAGLAGAAALIAGAIGYHKAKGKKK